MVKGSLSLSFASTLIQSLLHLSYTKAINPLHIPSITFYIPHPCLALSLRWVLHSLCQMSPWVIYLLCGKPSEHTYCKLPVKGFPLIWAFLLSLPPKLYFCIYPRLFWKLSVQLVFFNSAFSLKIGTKVRIHTKNIAKKSQ